MKQILNILSFEFKNLALSKTSIISTIIVMLVPIIISLIPHFNNLFSGDSSSNDTTILLVNNLNEQYVPVEDIFKYAFPNNEIEIVDKSIDELKIIMSYSKYSSAIILNSPLDYTYITQKIGFVDNLKYTLDSVLKSIYTINHLYDIGIDTTEIKNISLLDVESELINLGTNINDSFEYTYILLLLQYFIIIIYGVQIATMVAKEKNSKTMEVLITLSKPYKFIIAKVSAVILIVFTQLLCLLISLIISYFISKNVIDFNILSFIPDSPSVIIYSLLFSFLGILMYLFLFAGFASMVKDVSEVNALTTPLIIFVVIGFFIALNILTSGDFNNLLLTIASYFPLTSPIVMLTLVSLKAVSTIEIIISLLVLIISIIIISIFSCKLFKKGVTYYGEKTSFTKVLSFLKTK